MKHALTHSVDLTRVDTAEHELIKVCKKSVLIGIELSKLTKFKLFKFKFKPFTMAIIRVIDRYFRYSWRFSTITI